MHFPRRGTHWENLKAGTFVLHGVFFGPHSTIPSCWFLVTDPSYSNYTEELLGLDRWAFHSAEILHIALIWYSTTTLTSISSFDINTMYLSLSPPIHPLILNCRIVIEYRQWTEQESHASQNLDSSCSWSQGLYTVVVPRYFGFLHLSLTSQHRGQEL